MNEDEKEDIAAKARRIQDKLRQPFPEYTTRNTLVDAKTKHKSLDVNVVAGGAAPKGKRVIPSKQGDPREP